MTTDKDDAPLYVRVQSAIGDAIRSGRLLPGSLLPSEKELESAHGVSRITIRRALEELQREGLVERSQGRQARVVEPLVSRVRTEIQDDLGATLDLVRGTDAKVLSCQWENAPEPIQHKFEIADHEPVLRVDRLRSMRGKPLLHTRAYVPAWIGAKLDKHQLAKSTMLDLLMMSGVTISSAEQVMRAGPCAADIAPLLELSAGDPAFLIERLVRGEDGRPIQHLFATFRWDSFSYRISSTRSSASRTVEVAGGGTIGAARED